MNHLLLWHLTMFKWYDLSMSIKHSNLMRRPERQKTSEFLLAETF